MGNVLNQDDLPVQMRERIGSNGVTASPDSIHSTPLPDTLLNPMAPRLAVGILAVVFSGLGALAVTRVAFEAETVWHATLSIVYLVALLALQLGYFSRPSVVARPPLCYIALVVQAALVYLPLLQFGKIWLGLPGFLAGSVLLALKPRVSIPLFALIVASIGTIEASAGPHYVSVFYTALFGAISTVITGLIVFGLSRLARLVRKLDATRAAMARLAVADERLRFARDLHDLLGLSLSAITLKSELTKRLMAEQPQRAVREVDEVLEISRKALADVRSVASGYRELSLEEECRSARAVLTAADVNVRIVRVEGELPVTVGTVFATVLREGVTNVLRHSKAQWCAITFRADGCDARMEVVNDGVPRDPVAPDEGLAGGSGIRNLSHRVGLLGGELAACLEPDGKHRLTATVPLRVDVSL